MNRKLDLPALFLFTALLFGAVVRFVPAISNGFPLNDGGMFYTMIGDLKANHYILPQATSYNFSNIPFAYPPLGFYIGAVISGILPVSILQILLWLPALVNTLSILVFYKLAEQILPSRTTASLAVLVYALASRSFVWQVMGGGITRAFGVMFLLLMLWQCVQLFKEYSHKKLILTIFFAACAVLSHPQTALHAILGGVLLFLFYGRNKRGFVSSLIVGAGVLLLTAPWWVTVLSRYGIAPMLSAGQTSQRTLESYLALLKFEGLGDYLFIPTLLIAFVGIWVTFKQRDFFLLAWIVLAYLVDPRGGEGIALLAVSMLAGVGLLKLSALITRSDSQQVEGVMMKRASQVLVFGMAFYFILTASISDFQLLNTSLKPEDVKLFSWINSNVSDGKIFLLSTGREFSMSDPMQEWFPALTKQHSATTLQGVEWTLSERFFPWQKQLVAFQYCADVNCVSAWSQANGVDYDYLVVMIPPEYDESDLGESLRSLALSARSSSLLLVYESDDALVFEVKK
ncbi:MAG: glycosyltransferase family 39 protein [Chloroflexi bacterium]|nr:glycosyltransferase family 39 protein [Chloroflexota bacterium]